MRRGTLGASLALCAGFSFSGLGVATLVGCDQTPPATREWRPSDHAHPPDSAPVPPGQRVIAPVAEPDGLTTEERTARSVFLVACASCHGAEGRGDGPQRAPMMRPPSFASAEWQASRTDAELVSIISLGRGMMPAFAERIPPEGMRTLVQHLRTLGPSSAPDDADTEGEAEATTPPGAAESASE